jgi:hypothetical protein
MGCRDPWRLVRFAGDYTDCGRIRKNLLYAEALAMMCLYSQYEYAAHVRCGYLDGLGRGELCGMLVPLRHPHH